MISESTIERIKAAARIEDFCLSTAKAYGLNKLYCECPACKYSNDKKKQGLIIDQKKNTAKCFSCGVFYGNPIAFIMETERADYPAALQLIAKQYGIFIEETAEQPKEKGKRQKAKPTTPTKPETRNPEPATQKEPEPATRNPQPGHTSFCDTQLAESGLTYDDLRVETTDTDGTIRYISPFTQGTRDQYGNLLEHRGDDVLIRYFDLEARPVMYKPEKVNQMRPLVRLRWQNPAAHLDKDGDPIKYQSPAGSGSHVYIPEALRRMYKHGRKIKRLYFHEGEKKAEKACKHGMMAIGIAGIHNIAGKDMQLPAEIQLIVQRCEVEEAVFILDSDWRNLSETLKNGQPVDDRPKTFFSAVRKFKEYLRTLSNLGSAVEIYFGYIKFNDAKAKGIDDLLCTVLAGKEDDLKADFDFAVNDKAGAGKFIQVNKITMLPDDKIADFWLLNDAEKFAETHKNRLKDLKEFKIKGLMRKFNEQGKLEMAQQLFKEEQFWDEQEKESRDGSIKKTLVFDYVNAMNFLQRRGFYRYEMRSGEKVLIQIENRVLKGIDHTDVKDYTKNFCREFKRLDVLNMLMRGGPQYLGPEKLSNLDLNRPPVERATPEKQCLFFRDKIWEITAEGIKELNYGQFTEFVWTEKIIKHNAKLLPPLLEVTPLTPELRKKLPEGYDEIETGKFFIDYSAESKNSHFLSFLLNASNFVWRKTKEGKEIGLDEQFLNARHIVNKLTAIGYLLHDYKDDNELKAIIAMDGRLSEVGASNGRSGKSLMGVALSHMLPQVVIDGKNKKLDDDSFRYHEVTEKTKNLFFDDVRANFDFESLFQVITGAMTVNQKSGLRFTLRKEESPKILVTTNHAINGIGSSFNDRQSYVVFSDFYNDDWKPVNDFGCAFFSEWDAEQWNLFYNLMATALMLYFRSKQNGWSGTKRLGIVPPPMEDVEKRKLRQTMGENFLTWADAYFFWDDKNKAGNLNQRLLRKELNDDFLNENPLEKKYCNAHRFKEKVIAYCMYMSYDLNPTKRNAKKLDINQYYKTHPTGHFIGDDDKTGGKEYFTLANKDFNLEF
jgi:DNA primase